MHVIKTTHMSVNVKGAMRRGPKGLKGFTDADSGRELSGEEAYDQLRLLDYEGKRVIPLGHECDGFDYETGCPGHLVMQWRQDFEIPEWEPGLA